MIFGYMRVSRIEQDTALQEDALKQVQCDRLFTDKMSGKRFDRPEFQRLLDMVRPGDVIVVWRLDRLGRNTRHLLETVNMLGERGVELRSLKEHIDTTTPTGRLMFHFMAAMTEFERDVIRERTMAGLEAARARGRKGGRRPLQLDARKLERARLLLQEQDEQGKGRYSVPEIMEMTGFKSKATFYKYVVHNGNPPVKKKRREG